MTAIQPIASVNPVKTDTLEVRAVDSRIDVLGWTYIIQAIHNPQVDNVTYWAVEINSGVGVIITESSRASEDGWVFNVVLTPVGM